MKMFLSALAVLLSATTISLAQSLPNYGPNGPASGDSFGKPPSGTNPPGVVRYPHSGYYYHRRWHHHRHQQSRQPNE